MPIQRYRIAAQSIAKASHRQRVHTLIVDYFEGSSQNGLARQRAARTRGTVWPGFA
ncbi:hypothetical protein MA5S0304_1482 [Mycobacteroides abscessus 5S-0304]|nr:hypothetical protein MA5S0304_1482 [Mycobacteroides abscessus 5S-0304]